MASMKLAQTNNGGIIMIKVYKGTYTEQEREDTQKFFRLFIFTVCHHCPDFNTDSCFNKNLCRYRHLLADLNRVK